MGRGALTSVAVSPDGKRLVVGSDDHTVCALDSPTGKMLMLARGHNGPVTCVAISPDGRQLATGSADNSVQLWDLPTGQERAVLGGGGRWWVLSVDLSPDGTLLAVGDGNGQVRFWEAATGKELAACGEYVSGYVLAYLAFTLGMSFAVSDSQLGSTEIRKVALGHALLSYLFGTVLIASAVSLLTNL